MRKLLLIILLILLSIIVKAQSELTLPMFEDVFQSTYLKPTVRPEHTISIGLPGLSSVYVQAIHNGFIPGAMFYKNEGSINYNLDIPRLLPELSNKNMLHANADIDLFHLRLRIYNWDYWLGIRQRHSLSFFYPEELMSLAILGNEHMVGETVDFSQLGLNSNIHREYTLGLATQLDHWVFGGRISLLQGLSSMYLKPESMQLFIDDDMYDHNVTNDAVLWTSGIPLTDDRELNEDLFSNKEWLTSYLTRMRNPGASIALGASYQYDQRTSFSISVSDIGFIHWSDSTLNYQVKGESLFDGIDALGAFLNGEDIDMDSTINEFRRNFSDEEFEGAYTTWLSPKFYVSANYQLAARTHLALQFYGTVNRKFYPAFSVGVSQGVGRSFNFALTGSFNQRTITNLGFGLLIKPGPFQIYVLADNYYAPVVDPLSFTNLNVRVGMNLVFGRVKTQQGLPYR